MTVAPEVEFTVDELARRAEMTVRNVRAYTSRGLIDPPRLEGRTGYYSVAHLQRLTLIRSLVTRGFTLTAVENALTHSPEPFSDLALDLMSVFDASDAGPASQMMTRTDLFDLAGGTINDTVLDRLSSLGLIEIDGDTITLHAADVVRSGARAMALGLSADTVVDIATMQRQHLRIIASDVVHRFTEELVQPFLDSGLPSDQQRQILQAVETMIPLASQSVLAMFKAELQAAVETEILDKLHDLSGS